MTVVISILNINLMKFWTIGKAMQTNSMNKKFFNPNPSTAYTK